MKILFVVIVALCALCLTGCKSDQDKNNVNYTAYKTSYTNNQENNLNQKIEDILSMNEHQIKEIKDHAYQTAKAYDVNDISQNLVDIFNGI